MSRSFFSLIVLAVAGLASATTPAAAQFPDIFGTLFGQPPPRPPEGVPRPPPQQYPQQRYPQEQYPGQQRYPQQQPYPQQRTNAPPQTLQQPGPPPRSQQGNIETQPLPPPPGGYVAPAAPPNEQPAQPAQRQPRGTPQQQQQQPQTETAAAPPNDEVAIEPPREKVPNSSAVFAGLDKITGRITNFDVTIGETVQFGALQVTPRACYTRPPTETPQTDAFIEVDEVTLQGEIKRIYTGWMFAASPGLHAVEHPIYDIWLTDCKGAAVAEAAPEQPAQPPRSTRQQTQQRQPAQQQRQPAAQQQRRPQQQQQF
jgi:hypothetical protein